MWTVKFETHKQDLDDDIERLENAFFPDCLSVTWTQRIKEDPHSPWLIEALYQDEPAADVLSQVLGRTVGTNEIVIGALPEKDWVTENQALFPSLRVGRFLVSDQQHVSDGSVNDWHILVDAGGAFGTGHHGSTAGCLTALNLLSKKSRPRTVLDIGCGTGILSIAAAKAWRVPVRAIDTHEDSVRIARENFRLNEVSFFAHASDGDGQRLAALGVGPYDLIIANILAQPLCQMACPIHSSTHAGTDLILSGLLETQEAQVLSAYRSVGYYLNRRIKMQEWSTLILKRS